MARIFLSYSRVDRRFVEALADKLRRIYGHENVWFDEGLHGGDIWWEEILEQIADRDIFVYILSNDSVQSAYCQAEFTEARRLQKQIITVQARDRTRLTQELGDIHYINMANGVDDADALTDLYRSVNKRMTKVPKRTPKPLWEPTTPRPGKVDEKPRPKDSPEVDTPTLEVPRAEREKLVENNKPWWKKSEFIIGAILVPIIAAVLGAVIQNMGNNNQPQPTSTSQSIAQVETEPTTDTEPDLSQEDVRATGAAQAYETLTALAPTDTPTITPTPTETPISVSDIQKTAQSEIFATETSAVQTQAVFEQQTQNAVLTEQFIAGSTATYIAQLSLTPPATDTLEPTNTPVPPTHTPTATFTPTNTPTATFTPLDTPTNTPTIVELALQRAQAGVNSNAEWEAWYPDGFVQEFDGVTMVLVPAGCFMMGSSDEEIDYAVNVLNGNRDWITDEQPEHEQCIEVPFWIDKYEVTQSMFEQMSGVKGRDNGFDGDNRPIERITWFEARDFCVSRGGRLPTEKEWEYVASGPSNLYYPWGNEWNENYAVWYRNSNGETAEVGSRPEGISWAGALDMSGNVSEWVSSLYQDYEYDSTNENDTDTSNTRGVRGGSWLRYNPPGFRASNRGWDYTTNSYDHFGFRCARS